MNRFKKELAKLYPEVLGDEDADITVSVLADESLVVFYHPSLVSVFRVHSDLSLVDVSPDYPEITNPGLVGYCGGNVELAKEILYGPKF